MTAIDKPIIIIGAGYAGLCLALFLKKAGINSIIFEAYPEIKDIGAGIGLAPNGINILQELGLDQQVINAGKVLAYNNFRNYKGKFLARIKTDAVKKFGQPFVMISRSNLHRILYQEVVEQGIEVYFNKRLTAINEDIDGITAIFDDRSRFAGALIIGADGIHSTTRKITFNASPEEYTGFYGSGGFVKKSVVEQYLGQYDGDALNLSFGIQGFFGFSFHNTDELAWWCSLELPEQDARQTQTAFSAEALKIKLAVDYKDFFQPIPELISNSHQLIKTVMYDMPSLPEWYKGKIILIGDAAHAVSPTSGLGASLAIEDAMILAKLLKKYSVNEYQNAFFDFQALRKPRTEKVRAAAQKHNSDKKIHSPVSAWFRDTMMSIFLKLFGLSAMDWKYDYKIAWND